MRISDCGLEGKTIKTKLGWVGVAVTDCGVARLVLPRASKKAVEKELRIADREFRIVDRGIKPDRAVLKKAVVLIRKYFSGEQVTCDLPIDVRSHTPFQQAVWQACASIPFGKTRTYGWLAAKIKRPNAARAVGQAMGANPVPILVP